jgi:hypothetical protein
VYLLACAEQLDVELRDGRICLPDRRQVHHATIWALGVAAQAGPARGRASMLAVPAFGDPRARSGEHK